MKASRLLWLLLLVVLAACNQVVQTPEAATASATSPPTGADRTATPPGDPAVAPSAPAVSSETPAMSPTATPTRTSPPVPSATPSALPPTPTASATMPPTAVPGSPTPTAPPTPSAIIHYFRVTPQEADPGDIVTLDWATSNAATVTLWKMMATGQFGQSWEVAPSGNLAYPIDPLERNRVTFALFAGDEASGYASVMIDLILRCTAEWFFANAPDICPADAALVSAGVWQPFENGLMIWVAAEDAIYVLYDDGQSPHWYRYTDEWDPGEPELDPTLEPPPGFFQPLRGFGLVWREHDAVRDRLGWATELETEFSTALQRTSYAKYNDTYIAAPNGMVWRLKAELSGWELISAGT